MLVTLLGSGATYANDDLTKVVASQKAEISQLKTMLSELTTRLAKLEEASPAGDKALENKLVAQIQKPLDTRLKDLERRIIGAGGGKTNTCINTLNHQHLCIQSDKNLVLYDNNWSRVWSIR